MDYEQAYKLLETIFMDQDGKELNQLGDALIDFLKDKLEDYFAEKDHGHSFSGGRGY